MTLPSKLRPAARLFVLCMALLYAGCSGSCNDTSSYTVGDPFEENLNRIIFSESQDLQKLVNLLESDAYSPAPPIRHMWTGRRYACQWAIGQQNLSVADVQCAKLFASLKGDPGSVIGDGAYTELLRHMSWRWINTGELEKAKRAVFYGDVVIKHMIEQGLAVTLAEQAEFALLRGIVFWKNGHDSSAKKSLEEARRKAMHAIGERPALTLQVLETLGDFLVDQGEGDRAQAVYRQGMEQCVGLGDTSAAAAIRFRLKLASVQFAAGKHKEAYAWLLQAQPLCGDNPRTSPLRKKAPQKMQLCVMLWQNVEKVTAALENERRNTHAKQVLKQWQDFFNPQAVKPTP